MKPESTAPASTPPADTAATTQRRPRRSKHVVGIVLGLAAVAWLGVTAHHAWFYEATEDAYVVGHLHQVGPQVAGTVLAVRVLDNQLVKSGDVLVELDPTQYRIAVQKAEAAVAQARAQEQQAVAAANQAGTQLAEARARSSQAGSQVSLTQAQLELAKLTLARNEQLLKNSGAVTQAEVDSARSGAKAAAAAESSARANQVATEAAIATAVAAESSARAQGAAAAAAVEAAAAALRDAQRQLGYTKITAPTDGIVGNRNVETGNQVVVGQTLLSLAEPHPWIIANFKETQVARMRVGQPVELAVDAIPGRPLHGRIESLSPATGAQFALLPPDNATGNFNKVVQRIPVKITVDADSLEAVDGKLRLGYSVVVDVRIR